MLAFCILIWQIDVKPQNHMDTTGKAFVSHWSWASGKGIMNKNTAGALAAASSQVMKALDNWESTDVSKINADDLVSRFKNLRSKDFTPMSLQTYESRFKKALASYLDYVRDPGAWRPVSQPRAPRVQRSIDTPSKSSPFNYPDVTVPSVASAGSTRDDVGDYSFPLRRNLTARLILPRDLSEAEAKRLQAYIALLVVHSEEQGNGGTKTNN